MTNNSERGRPFSDVWDKHMIKGQQISRGHYSATCSYCKNKWKYGKPRILREHLANHCKKCPQEISLYFAKIVGKTIGENDKDEDESDNSDSELPNKKRKYDQTNISNFYKSEKLEKGYCDIIDRSITKAFVMSNIPFSVIENPWFVDMIKTLQPGYNPPTRQVLSGSLLEAELSRINTRTISELDNDSNFTIGKIFMI
jgi:hypothetical protein